MTNGILDPVILRDMYISKGMTIKEISQTMKISNRTVSKELKRHGLLKATKEYNLTHGMSDTRAYKIWQQMKVRCDNPKAINYHRYGGKGITYDPKWKTFSGFWEDMREGYSDDLTLDRIDGNKSYCKGNCRWATYGVQNSNKSDNIKSNKTAKELMAITGLPKSTIYRRIKDGWSEERIINTPKLSNNGR